MFPFKPKKQYTTIALYTGATVAVAIILGAILFHLKEVGQALSGLLSVLSPLVYAMVIAYLVRPLVVRFESLYEKLLHSKQKEAKEDSPRDASSLACGLAIASSYILLSAIILCFAFFVVPLLLGDTKMLGERLIDLAGRLVGFINGFGFELSVDSILGFLQSSRATIVTLVTSFGASIATTVYDFLIGLCLSIGILFHRHALLASVRRISAAIFPFKMFRYLERICFFSNRVFGKYLIGKIVECSIVGLIYLIVLPILGIPYPFLITIVMTITNFVPIIGAFLGGIPCGILILTGDNPLLALWFAIIVLAIEQIDGNIIFPKVIGSIIDLRAVWIMVAVALFGGFFGVFGMFLSPPLFSILYMLLRDWTAHRLEKKGQPVDTEHYTDLFATTAAPRKRKLKHLFFLGERDHEHEDEDQKQ